MEKNEENFGSNAPLDKTEVSLQKSIRQPNLEQEKSTDTPENCSVHKKQLTKCNGEEEAIRCNLTDHTGTCFSTVDRASSLPVICSNIERMPVVEINQGVEFAKPKIVVNKKKSYSSTTKFVRPTAVVKEKESVSSKSSTLCHTVKRALLPTNAIRDFPSDPFRKTYGCYTGPVRLVEANNLGLGMESAESSEPRRFPPQTVQEDVCVTPVNRRWTHKENIHPEQHYTVADREDTSVTPVKQRKMQGKREGICITPVQQRWSYNREYCFTAPTESKRYLNFQDSIIESSNLHGEKVEDSASEFDCNLVKQAEKPNHDPSKLQENVPKITRPLTRPVKCKHSTDTCFVVYYDEDSNHSAPEQNEKYHWKNTADKSCSKCPGCQTPEVIGCPVLNSKTFNIALETSQYACVKHRLLRNVERHHLSVAKKKQTWKKIPRQPLSEFSEPGNKSIHVYDFLSSETEDDLGKKVTPPSSPISFNLKPKSTIPRRRQRKPYTDKELSYLTEGVCKLGTRWNQILCTYPFHQCRTSVDLKEKYYRLKKEKNMGSNQGLALHSFKPFSLCELRRLKRGVRQHGYNWKVILRSFKFDKERTPADLRTKWKTICNVSLL
ncbi:uncharacterized protein LOC106171461 isoform X2 [Lingula anatina]|uniref:Uncharacterized protein LOC106171461 isoform X2 n=1 Tax=Lingula anatina TaxID=7574 RepID=A0A1S3JBM1_LINAN|nr:uncharacterized protein LOC106171461 isoform X2 [Lingula anatina]|eukprot:XP_013407279.1 uncharacterized protein LOC106171461 isoform X2 [Lingula anatina]